MAPRQPKERYSCRYLKLTVDVYLSTITKIIISLRNGCFPNKLKSTEVIPIFKKRNDSEKENFRPVGVLLH